MWSGLPHLMASIWRDNKTRSGFYFTQEFALIFSMGEWSHWEYTLQTLRWKGHCPVLEVLCTAQCCSQKSTFQMSLWLFLICVPLPPTDIMTAEGSRCFCFRRNEASCIHVCTSACHAMDAFSKSLCLMGMNLHLTRAFNSKEMISGTGFSFWFIGS